MAVDLTLDGNREQRRVTVAFRIILAIPHWIFASVLSMVAFVVIFFAWFAVLFTARMPQGMGDFLARILQYQTRVYAYGQLLLAGRFPPFDLGPADYAVELELDPPERFNRAAVFFRFFLQLFAVIVSQVVLTGTTVILFFVWLVTLVSGQVPASAYLAFACILRYQMRTWAYVGMLTTEYPRGLFGDRDDALVPSGPIVDDALPTSPRIDRFVLSGGAKAIIVLALVFGIGWNGFNVATASWSFNFGATAEVTATHDEFDHAYDRWEQRSRLCDDASTPECQRAANAALRAAIERHQTTLRTMALPTGALDEARTVLDDIEEMHGYLADMAETGTGEDLFRLRFQVEDTKFIYDRDYDKLLSAVTFG